MPKSLFFRLASAFLLLLVFAMWLTAAQSARLTAKWNLEQTQEDLLVRARFIMELTNQILKSGTPLQQAIKHAGTTTHTRITIIANNGTVLADSLESPSSMPNHASRPEVQAALLGKVNNQIRYSETTQSYLAYVAIPWYTSALPKEAGKPPLVIRVAIEHRLLAQSQAAIKRSVFLNSLWITLLAAFITFLVTRHLSHPLQQMTLMAGQIARGNFAHRLPRFANDEVGQLAQAFNCMTDQLQERVNQLSRRQQELNTILSGMSEGVLAIDGKGLLLHANPAAEAFFGIPAGSWQGRPLMEVIRHPALITALEQALTGERQFVELELSHPIPRIVEAIITCIPNEGPDLSDTRAIAVLHDVTELHRLEQVRRDFVGNVSHEMRTPLTAIKGFTETVMETESPTERATYLNIINEEADRLVAMVEDLLQLSRLESPSQTLNITPIDAAALTSHVVHLLRKKITDKDIHVSVENKKVPLFTGDNTLLEQVLLNLLDNAVKYTPKGGHISIKYCNTDDFIRFEVSDTGPGIHPQHQKRLFERFYRADPARSRALGGTGLGLAIVKHIIERHNGRLGMESIPEKGATFWFELPLNHPHVTKE